MPGNRVVYQNWIVEIGFDPARPRNGVRPDDPLTDAISLDDLATSAVGEEQVRQVRQARERIEEIRSRVRQALERLTSEEREFIAQFYFIGKSYRNISRQSGRPIHKLEALHKRTVRKLKKELSGFVRERFGVEPESDAGCVICESEHVAQINRLISGRDKSATWKPIIKILRKKYGLKVGSPQALIGHERYHIRHVTEGAESERNSPVRSGASSVKMKEV